MRIILLSRTCEARYEEDQLSPDFRLYRSSDYIAGVEVLTLFPEQEFTTLQSRNTEFVNEINSRVTAALWYVGIDIIDWKRQPRIADIARWLQRTMAAIPPPTVGMTLDEYPTAVYSSGGVEIAFDFIPRARAASSDSPELVVGFGPSIWGIVQSGRRLRRSLSQKVGSRYDHRDRPFSVLVSVRDSACTTEEVVNALYGDAAITFPRDNAGASWWTRRGNGTFGNSRSKPCGRNRRLSCVFTLPSGWKPGSADEPKVVRYDNPFALAPFPDDLLTSPFRFAAEYTDGGGHMDWQSGPPQ